MKTILQSVNADQLSSATVCVVLGRSLASDADGLDAPLRGWHASC